MAVLKCKMCGGDLDINAGVTVVECEYCGTKQTVPSADDEKKITLFGRANRLRFACEFDKAAGVYESIIADFPEEAEAYWGLVLCKYGIEYVDDPVTAKKIPTCHRSSFDPVLDDSNFELVMENADVVARGVYREEAKQIEELRRGIIEVSSKEEPYDIFICYKETADNGDRTVDSVIAQDVYTELVNKGYRVFFSRITLEDKLGQEYEPYIFAALNSAKIMLAFGTDYEYYNAVWVKNEWSRFLQLIASGEKKTLIPCYKDIDAYDMPKEFAKLQAQDMGKVGAIQDLVRGIEKIIPIKKNKSDNGNKKSSSTQSLDSLLDRIFMFLEDEEWDSANEYCEKVLDVDPKNGLAYVGKVCAEYKASSIDELGKVKTDFRDSKYIKKALKFSDEELKKQLSEILYVKATKCTKTEKTKTILELIKNYKDSELLLKNIKNSFKEKLVQKRKEIESLKNLIAVNKNNIYAVNTDGTVSVKGNYEQISNDKNWRDIIEITTSKSSENNVYGLKSDGTVVAVGPNDYGQCNVNDLSDIKEIYPSEEHVVALKKDGTVVYLGRYIHDHKDVSNWTDIVSISAQTYHTVGLKSNGTVIATGYDENGECDVGGWSNIVAIAASENHTVALKSDGTVVAAGGIKEEYGECFSSECNVSDWNDIIEVVAGLGFTAGLKSDGTVLVASNNDKAFNQCKNWNNIIKLYSSDDSLVGLKLDGTAVAVSTLKDYKCDANTFYSTVALAIDDNHIVGVHETGYLSVTGFYFWVDFADDDAEECDMGFDEDVYYAAGIQLFENYLNIETERIRAREKIKLQDELKEKEKSRKQRAKEERLDKIKPFKNLIIATGYTTAVLNMDGTVSAVSNYGNDIEAVKELTNITKIKGDLTRILCLTGNGNCVSSQGKFYGETILDKFTIKDFSVCHNIGCQDTEIILKNDGTVEAKIENSSIGQTSHSEYNDWKSWRDIVAVCAGGHHVLGLTSQGEVVACGSNDNNKCIGFVNECKDYKIVSIYASTESSCAIAEDGTLIIFGCGGRTGREKPKKNIWHNIVDINLDCGVGLTRDGKMVSFYANKDLEKEISTWEDIISITGYTFNSLAGLKADGTVVFYQDFALDEDKFNTSNWSNIIAISASRGHLVGLKENGRLVATGGKKECNVGGFKLFNNYLTYDEEKKDVLKQKEIQEQKLKELINSRKTQGVCQHCGGTFKGLFTKKCSSCGKEKDY